MSKVEKFNPLVSIVIPVYNGEKYVNGKYVDCISSTDVLALLDFLYYGESILQKVNEINEKTKRELKSLLG